VNASFLLRGFLIGLSIAAPVGPMAVLCIQRTLDKGRLYGLISGFGIATADTTYGFIAGFGLTFVSNFLVSQQIWIRLVGGLFLIYLGLRTIFAKPARQVAYAAKGKEGNLLLAYSSTYFLTLTNPLTILSFVAIFAGLGVGSASRSYLTAVLVVLGVFLGSASWWILLTGGVSLLRTKLNPQRLRWVNRLSGAIILAFGLFALLSLRV
jgi:threonine/homoserine/homoserine lactone efflux protein